MMETCLRCNEDTAIIQWNQSYGPVPGHYCPLDWEILMGMWVMTQQDRETALLLVDSAVDIMRSTYGYSLD
jgi:hypothetical protein